MNAWMLVIGRNNDVFVRPVLIVVRVNKLAERDSMLDIYLGKIKTNLPTFA
jgi:hypothetical protein